AKTAAEPARAEAPPVVAKEEAPNTVVASPQPPVQCKRTIKADIMAIPQPIMLNRLGAAIPDGLIFALRSDVDTVSNRLKADKRPRPLVLRANVGDCLRITFANSIPEAKFKTTVGV